MIHFYILSGNHKNIKILCKSEAIYSHMGMNIHFFPWHHTWVHPLWIKFYISNYFTIIRHHSSSFVILIRTVFHERSRKLAFFTGIDRQKPWKTVWINIVIFRESSWTMVVIICQVPPSMHPRTFAKVRRLIR